MQSRRWVLYHAGIRGEVKRCNLAYVNERRDARLFGDVTTVLMRRAQRLYAAEPSALSLNGNLFAIDATLIDLGLALFPWARWPGTQAAVKLNGMLALVSEQVRASWLVFSGDRWREPDLCPATRLRPGRSTFTVRCFGQ